eukprot:TRINITY_DN796_c5_g1_i1.p1 TRINITY_DN796_c5_g1~~TRINITY_DN796_c5_g1_i1.p1  ORF type:complete len:600 (-),score=65.24 TRINITY_DN796_c5_g1_i1:74-1873(-)
MEYIDNQFILGIAEIMQYVLMLMLFYLGELKDRYSMFESFQRGKMCANTRKLLAKLPSPLVLFTEIGEPVFWNLSLENMVNKVPVNSENVKETLTKVKTANGSQTAMEFLNTTECEENSQRKYQIEVKSVVRIYTAKTLKLKIHGQRHTALILQDETGYESMLKLEEKYQKMYVASIVHEIRTPLNGVMGILELLYDRCDWPEAKADLKLAKNTCMQLLFLTYDITDYSQVEAGKLRINSGEINIREVVDDCIQLLKFHYDKKGVKLISIINEEVPLVILSDKNRYMQILLNYLSNALKFTFEGEVSVVLEYNPVNDQLITKVNDTGIGIHENDIPKLFKMFGKVGDTASSVNPNGVGFGLSICKKLAEAMGGHVSVKSQLGVGSSFTFSVKSNLPYGSISIESAEFPKNTDEKDIAHHSDLSLLIEDHTFTHKMDKRGAVSTFSDFAKSCSCSQALHVDDNECNKHVLKSYSLGLGVKPDEASNGQQAVDLILARAKRNCCPQYKVVFMDINMPILDGIEATLTINKMIQQGLVPKVPILAVTAGDITKEEEQHYYQSVGFHGYLPKPITKQAYYDTLRKLNIIKQSPYYCSYDQLHY